MVRATAHVQRIRDPKTRAAAAAAYLREIEEYAENRMEAARRLRDEAVEEMFAERRQDGRPKYTAVDVAGTIGLTKTAVGKRWPKPGRRTTAHTYRRLRAPYERTG